MAAALALFSATARLACAAATPFAAPIAPRVPGAASGTLRVTVAMLLVIGAVLAFAWLARRLRAVSGAPASGLEVLAQVSLGTRERAVLLRVGTRQVLVGVAPGNVRTLHVVEANAAAGPEGGIPAPSVPPSISRPSFKSLLLKSLGK